MAERKAAAPRTTEETSSSSGSFSYRIFSNSSQRLFESLKKLDDRIDILSISEELIKIHPEYGSTNKQSFFLKWVEYLRDIDPSIFPKCGVDELQSIILAFYNKPKLITGRMALTAVILSQFKTIGAAINNPLWPQQCLTLTNQLIAELQAKDAIDFQSLLSENGHQLYNEIHIQDKHTASVLIGNLTFRLGNMFDDEVISKTDLLLLPADSIGDANDRTKGYARTLTIPNPSPATPGNIKIFPASFNLQAGYAYSIANRSSNLAIITALCNNLVNAANRPTTTSSAAVTTISIPLFGTGTGKLNPLEVAAVYHETFLPFSKTLSFIISVENQDVLQSIQAYFNTKRQGPDVKSRLHSDLSEADDADILQYDLIAENLFTILKNDSTNPPLNIGILAPWGRGKTSLMKRLRKKFDEARATELINPSMTEKMPTLRMLRQWLKTDDLGVKHNLPYPTVWFNPWNYQSSDMIWAGLADAVIQQTVNQIPGKIDREIFWLQLRLARIDKDALRKDLQSRAILFVLQFLVWGIISITAGICFWFNWWSAGIGIAGLGSILGLATSAASRMKPYLKSVSDVFQNYTKPPKYTEKLGTFHEVEADLNRVLDLCADEKKPLVIFVDDLDRCSPSKIVEVIEAMNVFINGKYNNKCYFILGMDAEMVAGALDTTYEKMRGKMGSKELEHGSIGWYFLDKFIQLPFFIPIMSESKKIEFLQNLLNEPTAVQKQPSTPIPAEPNNQKIANAYVGAMVAKSPAESALAIKNAALTTKEQLELDKMILAKQVESTKENAEIEKQVAQYSSFISSDPRSLKRFANLLRFYSSYQFLRMKKNQRFVEINVLAKWLAIMVKFPQLLRWIQWDSENKSGINTSAEDKAMLMDELVKDFQLNGMLGGETNSNKHFESWLNFDVPKSFYPTQPSFKINAFTDMPWIKSRKLFDILMKESEQGNFKNAIDCNVW